MKPFTQEERAAIEAAITRAEQKTSGEIVVVVAPASDGYWSLRADVVGAARARRAARRSSSPPNGRSSTSTCFSSACSSLCVLLAGWEPLRLAVTPRSIQRARAHEKAVEQFLAQNMHTTSGRTGVLIYVSFAEHYAEVIADDGIYGRCALSCGRR